MGTDEPTGGRRPSWAEILFDAYVRATESDTYLNRTAKLILVLSLAVLPLGAVFAIVVAGLPWPVGTGVAGLALVGNVVTVWRGQVRDQQQLRPRQRGSRRWRRDKTKDGPADETADP